MNVLKAIELACNRPISRKEATRHVKRAEISGKLSGMKTGFVAGTVVTLLVVGGACVAVNYAKKNWLYSSDGKIPSNRTEGDA